MSDQITKLFSDMTNDEVVMAIHEMKKDSEQGIIREDGIVKTKCIQVMEIIGGNLVEHLIWVQIAILQEAAYRFTPTMDELTHNIK